MKKTKQIHLLLLDNTKKVWTSKEYSQLLSTQNPKATDKRNQVFLNNGVNENTSN